MRSLTHGTHNLTCVLLCSLSHDLLSLLHINTFRLFPPACQSLSVVFGNGVLDTEIDGLRMRRRVLAGGMREVVHRAKQDCKASSLSPLFFRSPVI